MGAERRDHVTIAVLEALGYDRWVEREDLITAVAPKVAPGKALRSYERRNVADRRRKMKQAPSPNPAPPRPEPSESQKIRMGARMVIADRLQGLKKGGEVEHDGDRWRRPPPWCPVCEKRAEETEPVHDLLDPADLAVLLGFVDEVISLSIEQGKFGPRLWKVNATSKKVREQIRRALTEDAQQAG